MNELLTVLIPSIGRSTLIRSIESIPKDFRVKVLISGEKSNSIDSFELNRENLEIQAYYELLPPGVAKNKLIESCDSKYFLLLDDDDYLVPNYLEKSLDILSLGFEWIQPSFLCREESNFHYTEVNDPKSVLRYFYEYEKFTPDYCDFHLYAGSEMIMNTEKFKSLDTKYHLSYADDMVPILNYMIHNPGVFYTKTGTKGIYEGSSTNRRYITKDLLTPAIDDCLSQLLKSSDIIIQKIWMRAIDNLIMRVIHNNKKYEE